MDAPPRRWGILGTGWIAQRFCDAMALHTQQQVYAAGSRTLEGAVEFVDAFVERNHSVAARDPGARPAAYGTYEELVADPAVDVVYVATPHNYHHAHARLALEAGKHVVVEKPMGLDAAECRDLAALASKRGLFLMEAMWTLFLPKYDVIRQLVEGGSLGTVHSVIADMGEHFGPEHRIMRADLAGGPLYDLGTYPVTLATWLLGSPQEVRAVGTVAPPELSPSGVNGQTAVALRTASGGVAALHTTLLGDTPTAATVVGSKGTLLIDGPFHQPGGFTFTPHGGEAMRYDEPRIGHAGLHFEAAEATRCIAAGELESPLRPVRDTIATIEVMDAIHHQLRHASTGPDPAP